MATAKKRTAPIAAINFVADPVPLDGNQYVNTSFVQPEAPAAPAAPEGRTVLGTLGDVGITALKGVIAVPEAAVGLADLVSGGAAGQALENVGFRPREAKAMLDEGYSAPQKEAFRRVQAAEGLGDTFMEALSNPSVIGHSVVESVPLMGAGGVVARGAMAVAPKIAPVVAAAGGEGAVMAGSAAEQIRQQTADGRLTAGQAGLAAATGVVGGVFGLLGNQLAKKLGIADVDTLLAGAAKASPAAQKSLVRRVLEGAVTEGVLEELPQSVYEQVMQNIALDKPVDEGLNQAIVLGLLSGAAMGGGANVLTGRAPAPPTEPPPAPPVAPPLAAVSPLDPTKPAGPLTRAANVAAATTLTGQTGADLLAIPDNPLLAGASVREEDRRQENLTDKAMAALERMATDDLQAMNAARFEGQRRAAPAAAPTGELGAFNPPQDGDTLNPKGEPFKNRAAALRVAKKAGGEVVPVVGGFVVRPQEVSNVSAAAKPAAAGPAAVEAAGIRTPDLKSIPDAKLNEELDVLVDLGSERTAEQQDRFKALDTEMTRREDEAFAQMAEQDEADLAREAQTKGTSGSSESSVAVDSTAKSSGSTVENQSTEEITVEQQPNADGTLTSAGQLSSLTEKSPEGTVFQSRRLGDFVTQSAGKETDKTQRPLVAVKNFLTQLQDGAVKAATFLGFEPSKEQLEFLQLFQDVASDLAPMVTESLFKGEKSEYYYKDWMQALVQATEGGLDLDENAKTAIVYAVFSWSVENANRIQGNDDAEINAILGRPEEHTVDDFERSELEYVGTRQNLVINTLGQRITEALGLKASKDAPANILPDLQAAMGAHAMKLLVDNGMVVRENIPGDTMALLTGHSDTNTEASNFFIRVATKGRGGQNVKELATRAVGMQGVVDKLFGVEAAMKEPSIGEPFEFNQTRTKGTQQRVPSKLGEAAAHDNKTPFKVRQDMWKLMQQLSRGALAYIAGAKDPTTKVASNKKRIVAKNQALEREIDNFKAFVGSMKDITTGLFFEHTVMKQQRVYITTNLINPQASKVHRHALYRESWTTEINTSDTNHMNSFKLRVLEGLGVKTDKQANKTSLAGFDATFDPAKAQSEKDAAKAKALSAGVDVLVGSLRGEEMTEAKEDALVAAVQAGGENMHTLDALMAMAHWKMAQADGKETFTTQLMGEVDGVTNGPMLSHLLLGAAQSVEKLFGLLNRGGFFQVGSSFKQYNLWRSVTGHRDLYENTTDYLTKVIQGFVKNGIYTRNGKQVPWSKNMVPVMSAVYSFTGELSDKDGKVTKDGRNIIKTPLTAMMFGSSVAGAVNSMANNFVDSVMAKIEDAAAGKPGALSASEIIDNVNLLLSIGSFKVGAGMYDTAPRVPRNLTIEDLMGQTDRNFRFSKDQLLGLRSAFKNTIGRAVSETMESEFSTFIEQRKQMNDAAQLAFTLYNSARTALRDKLINELMDKEESEPGTGIAFYTMAEVSDDVPAGQNESALDKRKRESKNSKNAIRRKEREQYAGTNFRVPLHDLNESQQRELDRRLFKVAPTMHTYMSGTSGGKDPLAAGLAISKTERKLAHSKAYEGEIKFGTEFADSGKASTRVRAMERVLASPGVGMVPLSVHSSESAISHLALMGFDPLNIHDAHGTGVGNFEATARRLNQSVWKVMLGYSPATEMSAALSRTIQGLAELAAANQLPAEATASMAKSIELLVKQHNERAEKAGNPATLDAKTYLRDTFVAMRKVAAHADKIKFGTMAKMGWLDQYALEGGNYEVSEDERAEAAAAEKEVSDKITEQEDAALTALEKAIASNLKAVGATEDVSRGASQRETDESVADTEEAPAPKSEPFGKLGESERGNDPKMVEFFEANLNANAKQVLEFLFKYMGEKPASDKREYTLKLMRKLREILPADLPVQLITKNTTVDDVLGYPDRPARGWYSASSSGKSAVYIVGPDFVQSMMGPEVVLHELMHAAIARRLESAEGQKYKAELESLLEAVREHVKKNGVTRYDAALTSVDELIAYGMTNGTFQQAVLAQVKYQSKVLGTFTSALKGMVTTLSRLLGFKDTASANGLGVLLANVGALLELEQGRDPQKTTTFSMATDPNTYSTLDILQGLDDGKGTVGPAFQAHLREILGGIVQSLHGPFGSFKAALMENQALSPMDVWLKALATGEAPFASTIMASGLKITSQEAFAIEQVEATVRSALNSSETRTKVAYRQLAELYTEVYRNAKAQDFHSGDWAKATDAEKAKATELYEFVFKLEKSSGDRSDYLARFAALGLGHQGFNQVLQRATERNTRKVSDAKSFGERLQIVFENILDFFRSKITSTYAGQKADVKLRTLVSQLVDIEAKNRFFIATEVSKTTLVEKLEDVGKGLNKKLSGAAEKILNSSWLRNNSSGMIQGAGGVARTIVGNRVDEFMDVISRIRDKHVKERHGAWMSLVGEAVGPNEQAKFLLLGTKHNEKLRKDIIDAVSNTALSVFANGGDDLTDEAKAAITQAFMRSGAHTLLDHYTMAQIEGLLIDPKQLAAAIRQIEGQLTGNAREYYIHQARALGYFKITGKVTSQKMMSNAGNIARMFATPYRGKISEEVAATAQKSLEPLVSLYALSYLSPGTQAQAAAVLKAENARTDGNGVEFVLKLHRQLENESRDRLFQGSNALMVHGYTPEILNPYTDIQIASDVKDPVTGKSDGDELQDRGWSKGAMAPVDPADPDRGRRHMYVLRGAGLGARQTGIISWTNMANKGSQKHSGYLNPANQNGLANAQLNASVMNARQAARAVQKMFTAGASFDPTKVETTYMAPIVNPQGDIVNWRYLMQEDTKDSLLERDNRFEHILGALAGSIFDKETTASQNKKAMQALKEQHDAEYSKQADRYIWVGADSKDEDLRETWALLPDVTKQDVKAIWGGDGLFVRKDSLDIVFGYRKLSASRKIVKSLDARQKLAAVGLPSRVWDLDSEEFNTLQKLAIISLETMLTVWARTRGMNQEKAEAYSKRAATMITRGGRLWSEAVAETKDLIVVKTGTTLLGNIWSNLSTLVINGVPWKDIIHHHSVALKGATAYHADMDELQRLKLLLDSGHTLGKENQIRRDILRLEDSIARNPITKLVDAGLMPTIVEDIASEEDIYSYKSALVRKTESVTSQLPDSIRNLAKTVYMTHDTPLYQGLSRVTQLSDFVARYTLYQHLVNRKINPLTEKDALSRAVDSFIMYDVPMHPMLQYADDTGLFMFTKYFLRIQRVLRTMWMDNPARTLSALLLDNTMGLGPIVLDSAAALRIGNNPLESGAFKFFGSLDELMTIKPVMSVFGGSSGGNWK